LRPDSNRRLDYGGRYRRARHQVGNDFCTQIGNDDFAWFGTTNSDSRLNFLDLLALITLTTWSTMPR
jgi:hypothetical protein